jgi:outer membrane lipoprotein-sorting protein
MLSASRPPAAALRCALLLAVLLAGACGRKAPSFPSGTGTPFPEFASAYAGASASCLSVKTLTVSMALSGSAGRTRLRGRVDAGFAAPSSMRLEGRAPFGRPVFVLTAEDDRATLVLPRDERVLTNARPSEIIDALVGVALAPDTLRTIVSGCGLAVGDTPTDGRAYGADWAAGTIDGSTVYLRRSNASWQIVGAVRGPVLTVFYADFVNGRPATVTIHAGSVEAASLTLRLSQIEINPSLDSKTFQQEPPPQAAPLTLEELRRSGPLGEGAGRPGDRRGGT